jgi:hypothetical protein
MIHDWPSSGFALDECLANECFGPVLGAHGVLGAREERNTGMSALGVEDVEGHVEIGIAVPVEQSFFDGVGPDALAGFDGRVSADFPLGVDAEKVEQDRRE